MMKSIIPMASYNHSDIEKKWQKKWEEDNLYAATEDVQKKKWYVLDMFPYPSGEGLHVGHVRVYTASDIYARYKRMSGYSVLHPTGWDAFGLPAEQYALKNKIHPRISTDQNTATFRKQMKSLGYSIDWGREIDTTDPKFYKWTQWIFKQLYKKGLVKESYDPINWCPSCKTGLANEDLEDGKCERCGSDVEKRPLRQWSIAITKYADRLLDDLDTLTEWPTWLKESQRNWIGRNYGVKYSLSVKETGDTVATYSTHYEAFYADTFAVIASDHPRLENLVRDVANKKEILEKAKEITLLRNKAGFKAEDVCEGVFTGLHLLDPITKRELPLFVASYALADYGTGIVKCSCHDERDFAFAKKYSLPLYPVLLPNDPSLREAVANKETCFTQFGASTILEPKEFSGKNPKDVREEIASWLEKKGYATTSVQYKLRDWVFARQRYWGEPFPIVFGEGHVPYLVADKDLPVVLPQVESYEPTDTGESPLAVIPEWVDTFGYLNEDKEFISVPSFVKEGLKEGEVIDINDDGGRDSYQPKKNVIERDNVACIIRHPTEDKYLVSKWKKVTWNGFITGGIDEGETKEDAARKEVQEETGYTNIKSVVVKNFSSHGLFYHPVKEENRFAHYHLVVVTLLDLVQNEISEEEKAICDLVWIDKKDVEATLTRADMKSLWQFYQDGEATVESKRKLASFKRETNTMPQWAGSSWYWLRFMDTHNDSAPFSEEKAKYWQEVDMYVGGAEHATRHLIYGRFWHKFLYDLGMVPQNEPFKKLESVGLILGEGGVKMSKRLGNVINPDIVIKEYGADVLRLYEMFIGPFGQATAWDPKSIVGSERFLDRVYMLSKKLGEKDSFEKSLLEQTIKKVGDDIEGFKFNTAISQLMVFLNAAEKGISKESFAQFVILLAPFAPHLTEELWASLGEVTSVHRAVWPTYDEDNLLSDEVIVAIQIVGKMRGTITVKRDTSDSLLLELVKSHEQYQKYVGAFEPKKVIIIKNKIVNIVI